jgi:hypothetical protein
LKDQFEHAKSIPVTQIKFKQIECLTQRTWFVSHGMDLTIKAKKYAQIPSGLKHLDVIAQKIE